MLSPAVLILLAKSLVQPARCLRRLHQQHAHKSVALLADRAQPLFAARTVFARNQPQIAGHLLAALETASPRRWSAQTPTRSRSHPRMRHQQPRLLVARRRCFHSLVQLADLAIQHRQQPQQIFSPAAVQPSSGSAPTPPTRLTPQPAFFCMPRFSARCCNWFLTCVRISTSFCRCRNNCRRSRISHSAPTTAETDPRAATSECAPRRACRSSASAHNWPESAPHRRSTPGAPLLQQLHKPLTVAHNSPSQSAMAEAENVKSLRLAVAVDQLEFHNLTCRGIKNRYSSPTGMEITPYNLHGRLLLDPDFLVLNQRIPGPPEAFAVIQSELAHPTLGLS